MQFPQSTMRSLFREGFVFVSSKDMRELLAKGGGITDWELFADSWNDLKTDTYMADKGLYRKRRYAVFSAEDKNMAREPHQAHFQTLEYNSLNGGIVRWFEPIKESVGTSESFQTILSTACAAFNAISPSTKKWHIEAHQFRIEASSGEKGQPTPEGIHRDGRDYVMVLMIRRQNIQSGVTTIHNLERQEIGSFTLTEPLDAALVDDARVFHGVTAVAPLDPLRPAYRDVLVLTLKDITNG